MELYSGNVDGQENPSWQANTILGEVYNDNFICMKDYLSLNWQVFSICCFLWSITDELSLWINQIWLMHFFQWRCKSRCYIYTPLCNQPHCWWSLCLKQMKPWVDNCSAITVLLGTFYMFVSSITTCMCVTFIRWKIQFPLEEDSGPNLLCNCPKKSNKKCTYEITKWDISSHHNLQTFV